MKYHVKKMSSSRHMILDIETYKVRKEQDDGSLFGEFERLNIKRGDAVAILLHNPEKDTVILVRQFRLAPYTKTGNGLLWEIPAGMIETGEKPEEVAVRETLEETGYRIENPELLHHIILAPGVMDEYLYIYKAIISDTQKIEDGGGLAHEGEHLEVHEVSIKAVKKMVTDGIINDAKTIIALNVLD